MADDLLSIFMLVSPNYDWFGSTLISTENENEREEKENGARVRKFLDEISEKIRQQFDIRSKAAKESREAFWSKMQCAQ